jgi:hypothetical protein
MSQGLDMGRRLCIFGFCRSIEMLSDVVEDTVLEHGGEVCYDIWWTIHVQESLVWEVLIGVPWSAFNISRRKTKSALHGQWLLKLYCFGGEKTVPEE